MPKAPQYGYVSTSIGGLPPLKWDSARANNLFVAAEPAIVQQRGVSYAFTASEQGATKENLILRVRANFKVDRQPTDFVFFEHPTIDDWQEGLESYMNDFVTKCPCKNSFYFIGEVHNMSSRKRFGLADVTEPSAGILKDMFTRSHPGINTSYVYCGKKHSSSPLHVEDAWLYSKNIARAGWKLWLFINPHDRSKLEAKLAQVLKISKIPHSDFVRDNEVFIAPEQFKKWKIRYKLEMQGPGDMIITYPETYHQVLNLTDTLAEAINFAPTGWKLSSDYIFKNRSTSSTSLSAEDFKQISEERRVMLCRGTKRGPVERPVIAGIRTPLEKKSRNSPRQLPTPPSTTGSRQQQTGNTRQSSSAQFVSRYSRIPTFTTDEAVTQVDTIAESGDDSSSESDSDNILDTDEGTTNSCFAEKSQSSRTSDVCTTTSGDVEVASTGAQSMDEETSSVEANHSLPSMDEAGSPNIHPVDMSHEDNSFANELNKAPQFSAENVDSPRATSDIEVVQASRSCRAATSDHAISRHDSIQPSDIGAMGAQSGLSNPKLDQLRQRLQDEGMTWSCVRQMRAFR